MMLVQRIWYWINYPMVDIVLYSHHLPAWYCIDIVRRNSVLVTCGSERVKESYWVKLLEDFCVRRCFNQEEFQNWTQVVPYLSNGDWSSTPHICVYDGVFLLLLFLQKYICFLFSGCKFFSEHSESCCNHVWFSSS